MINNHYTHVEFLAQVLYGENESHELQGVSNHPDYRPYSPYDLVGRFPLGPSCYFSMGDWLPSPQNGFYVQAKIITTLHNTPLLSSFQGVY